MKTISKNLMALWGFSSMIRGGFATTTVSGIDNTLFTDALTAELYSVPWENECTSSLGVSMAMSLVYPTAIGNSKVQMQQVLGYSDDQSILLWENTTTSLASSYCGSNTTTTCRGPTLQIANRLFVDNSVTLNTSYAAIVGDMVEQLDFTSPEAGDLVNSWVNMSTNGLIDSTVEGGPLTPTIIMAINSIYLKATWAKTFDDLFTNEDVFYSNPDSTSDAHFMHQVGYFLYSHDALPGYQLLQLPFHMDTYSARGGLSMILVLPTDDDVTGGALSMDVLEALPNMTTARVALALPKFQFESEYKQDLKGGLQNLNLTSPFEGDLCMEEGRCDAFIDTIIQKTFIDVNENGVEAAAVTVIEIGRTAPIVFDTDLFLFQADRPFQFLIYESAENLILFEGQVGLPGIPDGSMAVMAAKHSDPNFWEDVFGVTPMPVSEAPDVVVASRTSGMP